MNLIILLLSFLLDKSTQRNWQAQPTQLIANLLAYVRNRSPKLVGPKGFNLVLLAPLMLFCAVLWLVQDNLHAVVFFIVSLIIVLFSFHWAFPLRLFDAYAAACSSKNTKEKTEQSLRIIDQYGSADEAAIPELILDQYHGNAFAPVFWFLLLGPAGALFYGGLILLRNYAAKLPFDQADSEHAQAANSLLNEIIGLMDWLSARLLGLFYLLVGQFDAGRDHWLSSFRLNKDYRSFVVDCGTHALGQQIADCEKVAVTLQMTHRVSILGLTLVALMTLAGWIH